MKFRHQVLRVLPVIMLPCSLLSAPAHAQFSQQAKLVGTGIVVLDAEQGYSVSLSGDGNTAIVGGDAAWVYTRSGEVWTQQANLVGTGASSVSLSHDGNTAILGESSDNNYAGAAWVYIRSGGVWSQQVKLVGTGAVGPRASEQGFSVSLSGDGNTAIVGGIADNDFVGAVWVYTRSGGVWTQQDKLVGTGALGDAWQGVSVSLSGDGSTAIVGGPADNGGAGAAWVYTRSGGVWTQQDKLVGIGAVGIASQGVSVSLSGDGNTAIVGGFSDNGGVGAAWVYAHSGGVWTQQDKLVGIGAVGIATQGVSVSLSGDGNTAIVGGPGDNYNTATGAAAGAAWIFKRSGEVWNQQGAKLVGTGAVGPFGAEQGYSVSLSSDGSTAIVGGPGDNLNTGAAWVFAQPVFAGAPGKANCHGKSVSALARQYGGLNGAAAALGYASVGALQEAILTFCGDSM